MPLKHGDKYKLIGLRIQKFRKARGLTQAQLAKKANISMSYLSKIEAQNCDKTFSLEVLFEIADALQIHAAELLE